MSLGAVSVRKVKLLNSFLVEEKVCQVLVVVIVISYVGKVAERASVAGIVCRELVEVYFGREESLTIRRTSNLVGRRSQSDAS